MWKIHYNITLHRLKTFNTIISSFKSHFFGAFMLTQIKKNYNMPSDAITAKLQDFNVIFTFSK